MPQGWEFHPVRKDRFAIVCRAQHPLACARSATRAHLAKASWLLVPSGFAARARFDELVAELPHPPQVYPVLSSSLAMTWWLMRGRDLLMLISLQMARPMLQTGEFVEIPLREHASMRPLGILQPASGMREAPLRFSQFLRQYAKTKAAEKSPRT
jgi:DNA-binding transcriptional LysR family regulator